MKEGGFGEMTANMLAPARTVSRAKWLYQHLCVSRGNELSSDTTSEVCNIFDVKNVPCASTMAGSSVNMIFFDIELQCK